MVIANVKNMFRKKAQLEYLNNYKMLKNKATFAVQTLQLKIESERNFENCYIRMCDDGEYPQKNRRRKR